MSQTLNSQHSPQVNSIEKLMSIFDDNTRVIRLGDRVYTVRVQGYNFLVDNALVLTSHIEVFESMTAGDNKLVGALAKDSPSDLDLVLFVKLADPSFHEKKAIYTGEAEFKRAKNYLANLSQNALEDGIKNHFLFGQIERKYVLRFFWREVHKKRWICVDELTLNLFKAPPRFTNKGTRYVLDRTPIEDEDGTIYAAYTPAEDR